MTAQATHKVVGPGCACRVEQAIFTSIRTPMGEGYRLVAMSPGITSEERAEITRRSPSHGSLCDEDPGTMALASYRLGTDRQCIAWTRYAGREHTARGGQRVHTHLVVVDPDCFAAFACDPFRIQGALAERIGPTPDIKPSNCLEPLELNHAAWGLEPTDDVVLQQAATMADALAAEHCVLGFGVATPLLAARWAVAMLPLAYRGGVGLSANLQYAPARELQLTCVPCETPELRRVVQGRAVELLDLQTARVRGESCLGQWCELFIERCRQQRAEEMCMLADELEAPIDRACLDRVVAICRDADLLAAARQEELEQLVARYANATAVHPIEARLARQLLTNAVRRSAALHELQTAAAVSGEETHSR